MKTIHRRQAKAILMFHVVFVLVLVSFNNCSMVTAPVVGDQLQLASLDSSGAEVINKGNPFACTSPNEVSVSSMRRLTREEYSNTVLALVGSTLHQSISADINTLSSDSLQKSINDFSSMIQDSQMTSYQLIAEKIYNQVKASDSLAQALGGSCILAVPVSPSCRDSAIHSLGLKAFRRPLKSDELSKYQNQVFALGANGKESLALTLYTFLISPDFLLLVEKGADNDTSTASTFDLTSYEIAARLSYMLWSAPPDAALYSAAANNSLKDESGLSAQIDRMLSDARSQKKLQDFFQYYIDPKKYSASVYNSEFLQGLDVNAVNAEYEREMYEFINHIVWQRKGSFKELLTSEASFAKTPQVASIYGHAPITNSASPAVMSGRRKGLFMRGPVLASEGSETHPILRGAKFKTRFLCASMGLPSGVSANNSEFFTDAARLKMSTRERTHGLTGSGTCVSCHSQLNPFGFAFENVDGMGRIRTVERVINSSGQLVATHPIDTRVDGLMADPGRTTTVNDGYDVIDDLADSTQAPACFVQQMYRFYRIKEERTQDNCHLASVFDKVRGENYQNTSIVGGLKQLMGFKAITKRRFQ